MNEQQLADLFSEQLDRMLQGGDVPLPDEAMELQELLLFGQQFSRVKFQPSPTAQAAFMGQVATWFGAGQGMTAVAGIPKILLIGAVVVVTALGLGVASFLSNDADTAPAATVVPAQPATPGERPEPADDPAPAEGAGDEILEEQPAVSPRPAVTSSLGDQIELKPTSSLGDVVPLSPSLEPTTAITTTPTAPAAEDEAPAATGGEGGSAGSSAPDQKPAGDSDPAQTTEGTDQDRGHGNDPGGYDPDNPGNSSGVSGGNDGNNSSLNPSDFGQGNSGGASGGNASGGGQGNSSGGDKGKSDGKGNKGGNGKSKKQ